MHGSQLQLKIQSEIRRAPLIAEEIWFRSGIERRRRIKLVIARDLNGNAERIYGPLDSPEKQPCFSFTSCKLRLDLRRPEVEAHLQKKKLGHNWKGVPPSKWRTFAKDDSKSGNIQACKKQTSTPDTPPGLAQDNERQYPASCQPPNSNPYSLFVVLELAPFLELEHEKTVYWSDQIALPDHERRRRAIRTPSSQFRLVWEFAVDAEHEEERFDLIRQTPPAHPRSPPWARVALALAAEAAERKGKERKRQTHHHQHSKRRRRPRRRPRLRPRPRNRTQAHRRLRRAQLRILLEEKKSSTSSVPAFPTTAGGNSAGASSLVSSSASPRPPQAQGPTPAPPPAPRTRRSSSGSGSSSSRRAPPRRVGLLLVLVGLVRAALYRRHDIRRNRPPPSRTRTRPCKSAAPGPWSRFDIASRGARHRHSTRDPGWDGGHGHRLCGWRGVWVGRGRARSTALDGAMGTPTLHCTTTLPLARARVRMHSVSAITTGWDTGMGMGTAARGRTDDGHGLAVREREREPGALAGRAEAESNPRRWTRLRMVPVWCRNEDAKETKWTKKERKVTAAKRWLGQIDRLAVQENERDSREKTWRVWKGRGPRTKCDEGTTMPELKWRTFTSTKDDLYGNLTPSTKRKMKRYRSRRIPTDLTRFTKRHHIHSPAQLGAHRGQWWLWRRKGQTHHHPVDADADADLAEILIPLLVGRLLLLVHTPQEETGTDRRCPVPAHAKTRLTLQLVRKSLDHQPCVRAVFRNHYHHHHHHPHTHSVSATTGAGHGSGYGCQRTDDGHSVFADSPFESESESSLHWQDEPALAEAESRPTSMDASPYGASNDGYGVGRSESNGNGNGNATDGRASPVYGAECAGYTRGASAVYDLDLKGSTLLAYDRDSAFVYEPRR
ncbi:hypothetical protein B0H13DRAFT_2289875 [Mycena leptocephala]|nr:hypothetical protein B0H13DRAFT_2289875 [Mycena leptocephala]